MQVQVCSWKSCKGKYSNYITRRLNNDAIFYDSDSIAISEVSCMWECKKAPNIKFKNMVHNYVNPAKASQLIQKNIK